MTIYAVKVMAFMTENMYAPRLTTCEDGGGVLYLMGRYDRGLEAAFSPPLNQSARSDL